MCDTYDANKAPMKKTLQPTTPAKTAPARKKLILKKEALRDLAQTRRGDDVRGGSKPTVTINSGASVSSSTGY